MRRLMNFFFNLLYHPFAWTYDGVAALVSLGRWADWRRAALPYLNGHTLLEIGFGTGQLHGELLAKGYLAFGLDESLQMGHLACKHLIEAGLHPALACGLAQAMPFPEAMFDCALATFPSEYITESQSMAEIYRVLKPGGRLLVIPMAWFGGLTLPEKAARWLFSVTGQTTELNAGFESRIRQLFSAVGFQVDFKYETVRSSLVLVVIAVKP